MFIDNAEKICAEVLAILSEREKTHGDPVHVHERIAHEWSAYQWNSVKPVDAAIMLAQMKLARYGASPDREHLLDAIGYLIIALALHDRG